MISYDGFEALKAAAMDQHPEMTENEAADYVYHRIEDGETNET